MIQGTCNLDYMKPNAIGIAAIESIRNTGKDLEKCFRDLLIPSRESALALTKLEESIMWATKSICLVTKE